MPTWTLILDDSFTNANTSVTAGADATASFPETPAVGAVNHWADHSGSIWCINANEAFSSDGGAGGHLYRLDAGINDQQAVFYPDVSLANVSWGPEICYSASDNNSYRLAISPSFASPYLAAYVADAFVRNVGTLTVTGTFNATHLYRITMSRTLSGGVSTLNVSIDDLTDSTPYASLVNATDSTAGLQRPGVVAAQVANVFARIDRIQWYTGALSIADPVAVSSTSTQITMSSAGATGASSPTYQWYRSPTFVFTPGVGTLISGATSLTLVDTPGGSPGDIFAYKIVVTDGVNTQASNSIGGCTQYPAESILLVGDSITAFYIGPKFAAQLTLMWDNRTITALNYGHSGATTTDWLPGAGTGYLTAAIAAAVSAGATMATIHLGANDCSTANSMPKATYKSNLTSICNELLNGHGITRVTLHYPGPCRSGGGGGLWSDNSMDLIRDYRAAIDEIITGTTILKGDKQSDRFFLMNPANQPDGIHPQDPTGGTDWTDFQAASFAASNGLIGSMVVGPGGTTVASAPAVIIAGSIQNVE